MSIEVVLLLFLSWLLLGLSAGLICSWIDCKYNGFHHFDWLSAVKMSFLGLLLVIWTPLFLKRSKEEKKFRW